MAYLVASLAQLRAEANALYPNRDKSSDGWIGDASHQSRTSDHNPDAKGAVHAFDLDEDLDGNQTDSGGELMFLAEHIRRTQDPRVKYVIYEGRIFSSLTQPWVWRPYTGVNAHRKHMHVSVLSTYVGENDTRSWFPHTEPEVSVEVPLPVLRLGHTGGGVRSLQSLLATKAGQNIAIDGAFGPATNQAVLNVQAFFGLTADGIVGRNTWGVLFL